MSTTNTNAKPANTTDVELRYPITINGAEVSRVTMRRPTVRDLVDMDKQRGGDLDKSIFLTASLAQMSPDNVRDLDSEDFQTVSDVISKMMGAAGNSP